MGEIKVTEKEFVKRVAPLVCIKGKKYQKMQAQQIYQLLRDIGFIIVDKKELQDRAAGCRISHLEDVMCSYKVLLEEILGEW